MLFLDTSAFVKRYVDEDGTPFVLDEMDADDEWAASALCYAETRVTLCHLGFDANALARLVNGLELDWDRLFVVPVDDVCLAEAVGIGCSEQVRTLDAVHLAAASRLPGTPTFVSFDRRQREGASALGLTVVPGDELMSH